MIHFVKLTLIILAITISPIIVMTQNSPACDSVFIDCCSFNTFTPNTLTVEVSNYSSNIFSYPGFILFNMNMDTMAIETVDYYGIGWEQIHSLNIVHPINLPFDGILELHIGFYESLACTFPISISDTTPTLIDEVNFEGVEIFPNPAIDKLTISSKNLQKINFIQINDLHGRLIYKMDYPVSNTIDVSELNSGVYFMQIIEKNRNILCTKFVKK